MLHREVPRARRHPMTIAIDYRPGHQPRWESSVTRNVRASGTNRLLKNAA